MPKRANFNVLKGYRHSKKTKVKRMEYTVVESVGGFIIKRYQIIVDLDTQGDKLKKIFLN